MNTCPVSVILASSDNQRWLFSPYISTPTNRWPTQCKQTTVHPCLSRVCFSGPLLSWRTDFYGNDVSFIGYKCTCALTIKARSVTDRETYVCFLTICNSSFKLNCNWKWFQASKEPERALSVTSIGFLTRSLPPQGDGEDGHALYSKASHIQKFTYLNDSSSLSARGVWISKDVPYTSGRDTQGI